MLPCAGNVFTTLGPIYEVPQGFNAVIDWLTIDNPTALPVKVKLYVTTQDYQSGLTPELILCAGSTLDFEGRLIRLDSEAVLSAVADSTGLKYFISGEEVRIT